MNQDFQSELDRLRELVSAVDVEFLDLLLRRHKLTNQIGELKAKHDIPVLNAKVEQEKLIRLTILCVHRGLNYDAVRRIFEIIFQDSRYFQQKVIEEIRKEKLLASAPKRPHVPAALNPSFCDTQGCRWNTAGIEIPEHPGKRVCPSCKKVLILPARAHTSRQSW
jgi:chorismate mutase